MKLKRGNPWKRAALYPKHGNVRCELLEQDEKGCATYAVAQCLLAMNVKDVDNRFPAVLKLCCLSKDWVWDGIASSPKHNLKAAVELGYISEFLTADNPTTEILTGIIKGQPVVLALKDVPHGFMEKDGFDFIGAFADWRNSEGKHATCVTGYKKPWIGEGYYCLMDTAVGRVKVSESDMKRLFERGAVVCVPQK